jgi:hypothetical protein
MVQRIAVMAASALLLAVAQGAAQLPPQSPGAAGMVLESAPYEQATDFVNYLAYGNYYRAWTMLSAPLRERMSQDRLREMWAALEKRLGRFHRREVAAAVLDGDRWRLHVRCEFERGCADAELEFSSMEGSPPILDYSFRPKSPEECESRRP